MLIIASQRQHRVAAWLAALLTGHLGAALSQVEVNAVEARTEARRTWTIEMKRVKGECLVIFLAIAS